MEKKLLESTLGVCPYCKQNTVFVPTATDLIFICDYCNKQVQQFLNGKIHWTAVADYLKTRIDKTKNDI